MGLSAAESIVVSAVRARAGSMLGDLSRWVAVPTGTGYEAGLGELRGMVTERLARLGARVRMEAGDERPGWLLSEREAGGSPPVTAVCEGPAAVAGSARVMLCGHLDTVHDPAGSFRALEVSGDGVRARGPGAADMKGGLLVAVAALEALAESGAMGGLGWTFVLNSDEETGSYASARVIREEASRHGVGLVFEPALPDGSLVVERPGSGQFMIEAEGREAHVGRDFSSGVSAVVALSARVVEVSRWADASRGRIVNVGVVRGGTATNVVPGSARAWGNVRFTSAEAERELAGAIDGLATTGEGLPRVRVSRSFARSAKPATAGVMRLAGLARAAAEDLGQRLPFGKTGGVCDGNTMQSAGIPVIDTLGVRGGGLHTGEEWVEVSSLWERAALTAVLLMRLAGGAMEGAGGGGGEGGGVGGVGGVGG
ncbi:MAG: M20/M25/M40 family metallo-hydrolase [Phycisphaeraceae bacterium]|nr:MAG: M20/M25/M40 family metallo-hydrolase [Phycisphaeraceae bacterium]